jgi:hypothetical protein
LEGDSRRLNSMPTPRLVNVIHNAKPPVQTIPLHNGEIIADVPIEAVTPWGQYVIAGVPTATRGNLQAKQGDVVSVLFKRSPALTEPLDRPAWCFFPRLDSLDLAEHPLTGYVQAA